MVARIYTSPFPSSPVADTSIITRLFAGDAPGLVGGFPASSIAFVDAKSSTKLTRAEFKRLVLAFAHGLRYHPQVSFKRGDTVLVFSPNSLAWPVVLYGG